MIHYQDARTTIETTGRVVVVLPRPLHDFERAREIHAIFPTSEGWNHLRYAVNHVGEPEKWAKLASDRLETFLQDTK